MDSSKLNKDLARAVDLFVMTKFKECFVECEEVITSAKMEAEQERNDVVIEAATALGIQALAEIDCWSSTTAFITGVYGSIDLCPPRIIQVCILLHAHVQEYLPCHSMVQLWLRNPQNLSLKQCGQVIRIYATHVLCPTGCQNAVKEIVDKCVSLTQTEKNTLLERSLTQGEPNTIENSNFLSNPCSQEEYHNTDFCHSESTHDPSSHEDCQENRLSNSWEEVPVSWVQKIFLDGCQRMYQFFTEKSKILRNPNVTLFFMGILAVMALVHSQTGDIVSSLGRLVILWRTFLQRLFNLNKFKSR